MRYSILVDAQYKLKKYEEYMTMLFNDTKSSINNIMFDDTNANG